MQLRWLIAALLLSSLLATVDHIARVDYLYWRYPWSDTFSHFLGSLTIGVLVVAFLGPVFRPFVYVSLVTLVAIGWELFEYHIGATSPKYIVLDTKSDLLFDAIGGSLSYVIARFTIWRSA
jgi:hypothetical protein